MKHEEAQLLIGAQPDLSTPALEEHLAGCSECTRFQEQMRVLDRDLRQVLSAPIPAPAGSTAVPLRPQAPTVRSTVSTAWRWGALAASLTLGLFAATAFWALRPQSSLARDVIQHVEGEPDSWSQTAPVRAAARDAVLAAAGVTLVDSAGPVVYASGCTLHGRAMPHLVVRTAQGPVTLMILRGESVVRRTPFGGDGYSGVLIPSPFGTIAVLARGDGSIDAAAEELNRAVRWR